MSTFDKVGIVATSALLGGVAGFIVGVFVQAHFEEKQKESEDEESSEETPVEAETKQKQEAKQVSPSKESTEVEQAREPVLETDSEAGGETGDDAEGSNSEETQRLRNHYHRISKAYYPVTPRDETPAEEEEEEMIVETETDEDGFEILDVAKFDGYSVYTERPEGFGNGPAPVRRYIWLSDTDGWLRFSNGNHVAVSEMPFPDPVEDYCVEVLGAQETPGPVFVVSGSNKTTPVHYILTESDSGAIFGYDEQEPKIKKKKEEPWK